MNDRLQPPLNNPKYDSIYGNKILDKQYIQEQVNLNELLQGITKHYAVDGKCSFILRSDRLPSVLGSRETLVYLFTSILTMIASHPPVKSKLFLYIKCEREEDQDIIDLRLAAGINMYRLNFHSNINTDEDWKLIHEKKLSECVAIARQHKGSFSFHPISNTGCLFSLTLPGKLNLL